ncbi:MAG: hypothetical protein ABWY58_14795 [Aeromicrobium sp.]
MTESPDAFDAPHDEHASQHEPTEVTPTGHPAIDEALERLERLDDVDLSLHVEEFDAVHGVLRESLANAGRDGVAPESA